MPGLTKRNLIAILIIIAFVTVSVLAWFYFPVVVFPLILALGAFGLAMYVALYPPGTGRVRTAAGRFPPFASSPRPTAPLQAAGSQRAKRPRARPHAGPGAGPGAVGRAGRAELPPDAVVALTDERRSPVWTRSSPYWTARWSGSSR